MAFTVSTPRSVEVLAKQHSVPLVSSKVIYSLIDDIRSRVIQLLPSIVETKVTGEANVLQIFDIRLKSKQTMKVAGCRVANGVVEKSKHVRVVRNRETVFEGTSRLPFYPHPLRSSLPCSLSCSRQVIWTPSNTTGRTLWKRAKGWSAASASQALMDLRRETSSRLSRR